MDMVSGYMLSAYLQTGELDISIPQSYLLCTKNNAKVK